jgi:hypothetical protein
LTGAGQAGDPAPGQDALMLRSAGSAVLQAMVAEQPARYGQRGV